MVSEELLVLFNIFGNINNSYDCFLRYIMYIISTSNNKNAFYFLSTCSMPRLQKALVITFSNPYNNPERKGTMIIILRMKKLRLKRLRNLCKVTWLASSTVRSAAKVCLVPKPYCLQDNCRLLNTKLSLVL